jgi:hypothetical protein
VSPQMQHRNKWLWFVDAELILAVALVVALSALPLLLSVEGRRTRSEAAGIFDMIVRVEGATPAWPVRLELEKRGPHEYLRVEMAR